MLAFMTRRRHYAAHHLKFLFFAVIFAVAIGALLDRGPPPERSPSMASAPDAALAAGPANDFAGNVRLDFRDLKHDPLLPSPSAVLPAPSPPPPSAPVPLWRKNASATVIRPGVPKIAVIIDDVGMDVARSRQAIGFPAALTLAVLPYAPQAAQLAAEGRARGHEIMIHMPMEAMDGKLDTGPIALMSGQGQEERFTQLDRALSTFGGYVGLNNHMGSRLTADAEAMGQVMEWIRGKGLLFVDSRTSAQTVAAKAAAEYGVPFAERHVFLDDSPDPEKIRAALDELENTARRRGVAVAIGHPREATMAALRAWLPDVEKKGFQLIPVSAAVSDGEISPVPGNGAALLPISDHHPTLQ